MIAAILAAAGSGKRMKSKHNKVFIPIQGIPVLVQSVQAVTASGEVDFLMVTAAAGEQQTVQQILSQMNLRMPWKVILGGTERQYSIANALKQLPEEAEFVVVHDAARPFLRPELVSEVIEAARVYQAAGIGVKVKDTIKVVDGDGFVAATPARETLWAIQTPQAFSASVLKTAYREAEKDGYFATDDAALVERLGVKVKMVTGDYRNIKITTPEDLAAAGAQVRKEQGNMRVGIGYDVHCLVEGRKLILGGVQIPHTLGLEGHSDADVLLHAIEDALLGAAGLGDIGRHFPDTDPQFKGISSLRLLENVQELISDKGWRVNNIDATIVAEKPKLAPFIRAMNENIAMSLNIEAERVNVKATTTEGLGFTGRREGISAYAIVSIISA